MNRDIRAICAGDAIAPVLIEPDTNGTRHAHNAMGVHPE
jgi:hypothetical protein